MNNLVEFERESRNWMQSISNCYKQKKASDIGRLKLSVSSGWYCFSTFMPWFLCKQASYVSSNEIRCSIIKIAFEELGEGDVNKIHAKDFLNSISQVGISDVIPQKLQSIEWLKENLKKDDFYILGLGLGLEIIANENIEHLLICLSRDSDEYEKLKETSFFKLHCTNEDKHIELSKENFSRFCKDIDSKRSFLQGCDVGINFWKKFWKEVTNVSS